MYGPIKLASAILRLVLMPNPFESLTKYPIISVSGFPLTLTPAILNLFAEPGLHIVTYSVVGLFYTPDVDNPAKGSLLYLVFYYIHIFLLMMLSKFNFAKLASILIIGGYITILFLLGRFREI